jgi:hypothetical protein
MFSIARASGAPIPFPLVGSDMELLYPLTIGDLGAVENWMLSARVGLAAEFVMAVADPDGYLGSDHEQALAKSTSFSRSEIVRFLSTSTGVVLSLWLCLRRSRSWTDCNAIASNWSHEELQRFASVRDMISGLDYFADTEWPYIEKQYREIMEAERTQDDTEYNWKLGFRRASDMGQCNFADISRLTLFQYQTLVASDKAMMRHAEIPVHVRMQAKRGGKPRSGKRAVPLRQQIRRPTKVPTPQEAARAAKKGLRPEIGYKK